MKIEITIDPKDLKMVSALTNFLNELGGHQVVTGTTETTKKTTRKKAIKKVEITQAEDSTVEEDSSISISQVRAMLSEKVEDHRTLIKKRLQLLEAPNVTKLDPSKYEEFYTFLKHL